MKTSIVLVLLLLIMERPKQQELGEDEMVPKANQLNFYSIGGREVGREKPLDRDDPSGQLNTSRFDISKYLIEDYLFPPASENYFNIGSRTKLNVFLTNPKLQKAVAGAAAGMPSLLSPKFMQQQQATPQPTTPSTVLQSARLLEHTNSNNYIPGGRNLVL